MCAQVRVSRRTVVLGAVRAAAAVSVLAECAAGRGAQPVAPGTVAPSKPAQLTEGAFDSRFRRGRVGWAVAVPRGVEQTAALPVLVFLHGLGGDHRDPFDQLDLHGALQAWTVGGGRPFAIATVDGADAWWKPQSDGTDAGRVVVEEFVPLLRGRGLDVDSLALGGVSMGGYGALRLAGSRRLRLRNVSVIAPALGRPIYRSGPLTDVSQHPDRLRGIPVQLVVGDQDGFLEDDLAFVEAMRNVGVSVQAKTFPGGHTSAAMKASVPEVIRFVGEHLTA